MSKAILGKCSVRLVLLALCWLGQAQAHYELDAASPALKGKLFSGAPFDLAQMKGQVVLVNFYSSFCKFCAYEIGNLETYYEQHKDQNFAVIAIGIDAPEHRERAERMLATYNLPGTVLGELEANGFGIKHPTPTCFIIDKQGVLRHIVRGAKLPQHYERYVTPLLAQ